MNSKSKLNVSMGVVLIAIGSSALALDFKSLSAGYSTDTAPKGFLAFSKKNGVDRPNTCAVRLSHALFLGDKSFFKDVKAKSGIEWLGLIVRADDLAIVLNQKLQKASLYESADKRKGLPPTEIKGKKGIVFFDKLEGWVGGTGHIALWDGKRITDRKDGGKDFFKRGERIYFWPLK